MDASPGKTGEISIDSGFRAIMFTDLKDSTLMTTYMETPRLSICFMSTMR